VAIAKGDPNVRVVIFGATGGLGSACVQKALDEGHRVTAFVRSPEKVRLKHAALALVKGDALDAEAVARVIPDHDAVLSALGPANGVPAGTLISTGTRFILDGMKRAGVRRFVFASGLMVGPGGGMSVWKRLLVGVFRLMNRALYLDKVVAEATVRDSGLDWIIVRPPVLAPLPARGQYRVGADLDVRLMDKFAFADVADCMVRELTDDRFVGQAIELSY
jgi:putative NADH-flavin reductase